MDTLHISLLGELRIRGTDQDRQYETIIESRRAQELLCYLLLHRDRMHERERLATLLWPDCPSALSKRYLRQTLWQVQSDLNHKMRGDEGLLLVEHDRVGINPYLDYWLDIVALERAFADVVDRPGRELSDCQAKVLSQAVQLYQGDLLDGWYLDWCTLERERYQMIYLALLDKLMGFSEAHQAYEAGVVYGMQILRYDRAREQTHRQLMHLYSLADDRTAAIHQYDACVAALREELNVLPAPNTVALYERICAERTNVSLVGAAVPARRRDAQAYQETDVLHQIEEVQALLEQLQERVTHLKLTLGRQVA